MQWESRDFVRLAQRPVDYDLDGAEVPSFLQAIGQVYGLQGGDVEGQLQRGAGQVSRSLVCPRATSIVVLQGPSRYLLGTLSTLPFEGLSSMIGGWTVLQR